MKNRYFINICLFTFLNASVIAENSNDHYFSDSICSPNVYTEQYLFKQDYIINIKDIQVTCLTIPFRLDINLSFNCKQGIKNTNFDLEKLKTDIIYFIKNYPDKAAYWETVNKNLVKNLLADFPILEALQLRMKVFANSFEPNDQWSIVRYDPKSGIEEHFGFAFNAGEVKDAIDSNSFLEVEFVYSNEIDSKEYIDIFLIKADLISLFRNQPLEEDPTKALRNSIREIFDKYLKITSVTVKLHRNLPKKDKVDKEYITIIIKEEIA